MTLSFPSHESSIVTSKDETDAVSIPSIFPIIFSISLPFEVSCITPKTQGGDDKSVNEIFLVVLQKLLGKFQPFFN